MSTLTFKNSVKSLFIVGALCGASISAQADVLPTDIVSAIETNLSAQTAEMLAAAKREIVLSLQTQLAESLYELTTEEMVTANQEVVAENHVTKVNQ